MVARRTAARIVRVGSLLAAVAAVGLTGCSTTSPRDTTPPFLETGDLPEIRRRGTLRALIPRTERSRFLPRGRYPLDIERELVESYALEEGLELAVIEMGARRDLIPALLEGKGDLIVANLTATEERRRDVSFTVPVMFAREQIVSRADDRSISEPVDLMGRTVAVRRSSSFYRTIRELSELYPGIEIQEVDETLTTDEIIDRVASRRLDVTVADSNLVQAILNHRDDVRAACDLTGRRPISWAVRPGAEKLLEGLNHFLSRVQLATRDGEIRKGDLDEIRRQKVLRVLTRNSAATYFLWRGQLMGFEYELAKRFADEQGLRLEVIVPPRGDDLIRWLVDGRGDLVAAALTPTESAEEIGADFSRSYGEVSHVVVQRRSDDRLESPEDLEDRNFFVHRSSAHWHVLEDLRSRGVPLYLQPVPERFGNEEIIAKVADGRYDLTVAYSHILDVELTWRDDVRAAFPLGDPVPLTWAVRASNPELKEAIDAFLEREYRGLFYNVIYKKYFKDPKKIRRHTGQHVRGDGSLSTYDDLVKRYAALYGFDWRLIAAVTYQESRFDPEARSFAGAVGLLQVLPRTARQMGVDDLLDPAENIHAGVKYLAWLRERFEDDLPVKDRMWFTLAAYNAGHGHVVDARRLAAERGWDPDRWFGNVERAMLLLARPEYARQALHGYCRGSEPVEYVRAIRARYNAYLGMVDS